MPLFKVEWSFAYKNELKEHTTVATVSVAILFIEEIFFQSYPLNVIKTIDV